MKYRKDFVTNSSSSSYICEICGNCESGYDVGLSEFGMSECVNGHIFCDEHKLSITETKEDLIKSILENEYNHSTEEELNDMDIEELFNKNMMVVIMKYLNICVLYVNSLSIVNPTLHNIS